MNRIALAAASAALALVAAAPASAAVTFDVNATFVGGGTLTGNFTTNDAITQVTGLNLQSSANGAFVAVTYANLGTIDNQQLPTTFRLTVNGPPGRQVQLVFSPSLTAAGGVIGPNSFENQAQAGNRTIVGSVTARVAAVPEPASWGLMMLGTAMVGAGLRSRRRRTSVTYA